MKFSIKNILKYVAIGAVLASGACSDDIMVSEETDNSGVARGLTFTAGDMLEVFSGINNDATRAGDTKTEKERKIKTLHVFFFNGGEDGELLTSNYTNFNAYQKFNLEKDKGDIERYFLELTEGERNNAEELFNDKNGNYIKSNIRVVAIANIDALDGVEPESDDNRFHTRYSDGKIQKAGRTITGDFMIEKYSDLQEWVYYPKIRMNEDGTNGDISELPEAGMPMIGEEIIDFSKASAFVVNMKALMAKVNVAIKLDPDQFTDNLPTLTITEYGVLNMPIAVPFKQPKGEPATAAGYVQPNDLNEYFDAYDVTKQPMFHKNGTPSNWDEDHGHCAQENHEFTNKLTDPIRIRKGADPVLLCSYYTFENINMPDYAAKRAGVDGQIKDAFTGAGGSTEYDANYPEGVEKKDYQRWKPTIAYKDRASAMILKGEYTTHQGLKYNAQFTIYLGMDTDKDFKVKRNHKYDNNIVIKGLDYIRNSVDDVYTFDGRVNVVDDNPFYLAIVNERKIDVHATALPMDIWLMDQENKKVDVDYNTDIEFEIPEDAQSWIQMVYISRDEMIDDNTHRFYAGAGIEPYFYTNLLDDIKDGTVLTKNDMGGIGYPGHELREENGLQYGAQCGSKVIMRSTPTINNSRSRIYFYIDENTKNWKFEGTTCTGTPDRKAQVKIKYKSYRLGENGDTLNVISERFRTIEIEQRGLLRVKGPWKSWHTESEYYNPDGEPIDETFIEYYEEYLNHIDPLEEHSSEGNVYEGLAWGMVGENIPTTINSNNSPTVGAMRATEASIMTNWTIQNTKKNNKDRMSEIKLYDTKTQPYSAVHYCYGKNKRNYDGSVPVDGSDSYTKVGSYLKTGGYYGWYMPGIKELETALVEYYTTFGDFQNKLYWSCAPTTSDYYARSTKVLITKDSNGKEKVEYVDSDTSSDGGYQSREKKLRIRAFYRRNPNK